VRVQAGRQYYQAGKKLVLDEDLDGVVMTIKPAKTASVDLMWAKMSEGYNSVKNPAGALMGDKDAYADADLFEARLHLKTGSSNLELFGLYYNDAYTEGDYSYLPNGLGYFDARFRPNISDAMAFGLSGDGSIDVADGLDYEFEADYLSGHDNVDNTDYAGGILDVNNGSLSGYNAYLKLTQHLTAGAPLNVGLLFGLGSGDDDPTGGPGNINKIQTMGFFPLTNVWEDSVMPDVGGISPQGLGSPVSRGYREFENTTAIQGRLGVKPHKAVKIDASYTYLVATQPVFAWDATGTPTSDSASDLGMELDGNFTLHVYKGFTYKALFGYFMPGTATGYLMLGNDDNLENAWELKQVVAAKF